LRRNTSCAGYLFHIGNFPVRSYGLIIAIAIILTLYVPYYLASGTIYRKHIFPLLTYLIVGGIAGARLWEVLFFQGEYYSKHILEILEIWNGGLSIQGGIVGGFLAGMIYTHRHKLSFWEFADVLAPAFILGQAIGRITCFLNGDAFGAPNSLGEGTLAYDTYGPQPLWPAELFEMQWNIIVFALLIGLKNVRWPKGSLFLSYNILYSIGRYFFEFLRGDTPQYALDWTAAQWTSVTVIAISIFLLGYSLISKKWRISLKPLSFKKRCERN
jgi:phosphatidylglycerol:prolipoprotein diacylglycerol transferase